MSEAFWQGRKVLITGHTGLRGSALSMRLQKEQAQVFGYGLAPKTSPNLFEAKNIGQNMTSTFADIRDFENLKAAIQFTAPEVIFHLAGGGGLKESWDQARDIVSSQVLGTTNLLEVVRETPSVRAVIILSSDKVYRATGKTEKFREEDPLGGNAPAAAAKAATELLIESYLGGVFSAEKFNKHKVALATARMGAVIGGGDFDPASLIFQLVQASQSGLDLPLKNPASVRPWFDIDDAVNALMVLAEALITQGPKISGAWNFGPSESHYAAVNRVKQIFAAALKNQTSPDPGEAIESQKGSSFHSLLDCSKAQSVLGWRPVVGFEESVRKTAQWYKNFYEGKTS